MLKIKTAKRLHKLFSLITALSLLFQTSGLYMVAPVLAEELTPTPEITAVPTPPEATPTLEITPEPTLEPTIEPTPTPEIISPTPTEELTPTPTEIVAEPTTVVTETPQENQSTPEPQNTDNPEPVETIEGQPTEISAVPTVEVKQPEVQGHLETFILTEEQTSNASSLDLGAQEALQSACLTTDKPDYAPTEVVLIAGTDFIPGQTYTILITSEDPPSVHFETQIVAESDGTFFYAYQLDGISRLNYKIEAKDNSGQIIATVTFTDPPPPPPGITLVEWNFLDDNRTADSGITANLSKEISREIPPAGGYLWAGWGANEPIATYGWENGSGIKWWQVEFVTSGHDSLALSSKQWGNIHCPRDFKVQYSINSGGTWTDVPGASVTVANDWTTGVLTNISLPSACNDQNSVMLRWIMTSNTSVSGGTTLTGQASAIDDIVVMGELTPKVRICHSTSSSTNPYNEIEPNKSADVQGHDGDSDDIIPPFDYDGGSYPGKNWTTEGQAIWNNGCVIPVPTPVCGNGTIESGETCDDNNTNNGDGCSSTCQLETGTITVDKITNPSGSLQEFTFHIVQIDPNSWNNATQHYNPLPGGFSQTINVADLTTPPVITVPTGDYDLYEDAPSGWTQSNYTCIKNGWSGQMNYNFGINTGDNVTCTFTNTKNPYCGDGIVNQTSEQCDDGNIQDGDGCSANCTIEQPECQTGSTWASQVISNNQGTLKSGLPITDLVRINPDKALGANDNVFYSLGKNGTIVLNFAGFVTNENGNDISFHEVTWGRDSYHIEKMKVEVSQDNGVWFDIGEVTNEAGVPGTDGIAYLDFSSTGLEWIKYIRLTDTTDFGPTPDNADGYDLDAVDATNQVCEEPVEYGSITITKDVVPNNSSKWDFVVAGPGPFAYGYMDLGDGESHTFNNLIPGNYNITESTDQNYTTNIVCNGIPGFPGSNGYLLSLQPGQNVSCLFTNTRNPYCGDGIVNQTSEQCDDGNTSDGDGCSSTCQTEYLITFNKQVRSGAANPNEWSFNVGGYGTVANNGTAYLLPGNYPVTEIGPVHYIIIEAAGACHRNPAGSDNIELTVPGASSLCQIANNKSFCGDGIQDFNEECDDGNINDSDACSNSCTLNTGTLRVQKTVNVADDLTDWEFKLDDGDWIHAGDNGIVDFGAVATGNHTITENTQTGYYLHSVSGCTPIVANNNSATAAVTTNQQTTCVFNNYAIPVYTGRNTCPTNAPIKKLINSYTIGAQDADGETLSGLTAGNYLFEAIGTFVSSSGGGWKSDAAYSSNNNWVSIDTNYGIHGTAPNYGAHALLANLGSGIGIVDWGIINAGHQYNLYTSSPANPQFLIGDRYGNWYGTPWDNQTGMFDNTGSLTLNIYDCIDEGKIEGYKYNDLDGDGQKDAGEPGLNDWEIKLIDMSDQPVTSTNTGSDGSYSFNVLPGQYQVCETQQTGWTNTDPGSGDLCKIRIVNPGETVSNVDFGNQKLAEIWWYKIDANLAPEESVGGYIVAKDLWNSLVDGQSGPKNENISTVDAYNNPGAYNHIYVTPGRHSLAEVSQNDWSFAWGRCQDSTNGVPSGWLTNIDTDQDLAGIQQTFGPKAPNYTADYGPLGTSAKTYADVNLSAGQRIYCVFYNERYGSIDLGKCNDINGDGGECDGSEPMLPGWTLFLDENSNGILDSGERSGVTNSQGMVNFANVLPRDYGLCEVQQSGWVSTKQVSNCYGVSLNPGSGIVYYFANFELGKIQGRKYEDLNNDGTWDSGEPYLNNWTIRAYKKNGSVWDPVGTYNTGDTGTTGQYRFEGLSLGQYRVCEVLQSGWAQSSPTGTANNIAFDEAPRCRVVNITASGQVVTGRHFGNVHFGSVSGYKFEDRNADTRKSENEAGLSGWEIYIDENGNGIKDDGEQSTITGEDGSYSFGQLLSGEYSVCEVPQFGWLRIGAGNCQTVTVNPGQNTGNTNFGNFHWLACICNLTKTNDKLGIDLPPGASLTYTLKFTIPENGCQLGSTILKDLLPGGFKYHIGSWTANSNIRGDLKALGVTTEPTYASPGTWNLGETVPGEEVTLTYIADIDGGQQPGNYKDLAWARGTPLVGDNVLANADTGIFVGTNATVVKDQQPGSSISIEKEEIKESQVLGAATGLPGTGINTRWLVLAIILLAGGLITIGMGLFLRRKNA